MIHQKDRVSKTDGRTWNCLLSEQRVPGKNRVSTPSSFYDGLNCAHLRFRAGQIIANSSLLGDSKAGGPGSKKLTLASGIKKLSERLLKTELMLGRYSIGTFRYSRYFAITRGCTANSFHPCKPTLTPAEKMLPLTPPKLDLTLPSVGQAASH